MSIATDKLSESSHAAAWPEFLHCADSPRARAHLVAMLTRIQKAHRAGDRRQLRYLTQQYLTSHDARLAATRLASRKMRWGRRPKKSQLKSIAENLNAFQGTREEVRLTLIRKGPEKFRPTLDFGIENRALQYLVLSVLYAIAELHPRQFATRGGVPAAISQVANAMKAGNVRAREIDIKDFYPSFDGNRLVDLIPVPKGVIERVLLSQHLNIVPSNLPSSLRVTEPDNVPVPELAPTTISTHIKSCFGPADTQDRATRLLEVYLADARRGIPQGSAASPILAEMLLAPLLSQLPPRGEVVAYADNVLLITHQKDDAVMMTESLRSALKAHPAGQFWPNIKRFPPGGPIEFLGHRFTAHDDEVTMEPTLNNQEKFKRKMNRELAFLKRSKLPVSARARMRKDLKAYVRSWTANFRACDGIKIYKQHWLARISASEEESIMPKLEQACTKRMVFFPHPDQEEIITAAIKEAKKQTGSEVNTVALEALAQAYMGVGIQFKTWQEAMVYARRHSDDSATFIQDVITHLESLCPEVVIEAKITVPEGEVSADEV
jgi:hypothetical protein